MKEMVRISKELGRVGNIFLLSIIVCLSSLSLVPADASAATVPAGTSPFAVAVNPATNKVYAANYDSANVTVIKGTDNSTTTVSAGTMPGAVAVIRSPIKYMWQMRAATTCRHGPCERGKTLEKEKEK